MAATRRHSSLQIFQDPLPPQHHQDVAAFDPHYLDAFPTVTNVSNYSHTLLAPPETSTHEQSPRKTRHISSSPPPKALAEKDLNSVSLPPPREPQFETDAPMKKTPRLYMGHPHVMAPNPHFFASFPGHMDKENVYALPEPSLPKLAAAEPPLKPGNKRPLGHDAQPRDRGKKPKTREAARVVEDDGPLPGPDEMPLIDDDGLKPPFSYAQLIGMAILRAPKRQLTLAQIYKWISDTFAFYRNSQDTGWQNSIRHNLSLSKSFFKIERPKDDPGKGHYWLINEGFEKTYYKVRTTRRPTNSDGFAPLYTSELARPSTSAAASFPPLSSSKGFDSSKFPEETELSSDATIPCSDPAAHDGHDPATMLPPRRMPSSPPPPDIRSSPPAPVSRSVRDDTPPRAPRFPPSSRSGGRKRKFGDSGYYSSIESSAIKLGPAQTSEADLDRPAIKRGRAEEEIARIRGSSYDSPTKLRPHHMKQPSANSLISSPSRPSAKTVDPLTPAIIFKRPALPPASASPNTNLRNHRNMMRELVGGSPDKSLDTWVDTSFLDFKSWSPAVTVPNEESVSLNGHGFESTFDIFGDYDYNESPLKKSAKRPRLERAVTSTGILADITGTKSNMKVTNSPTPNWKLSSAFLNIPNLSPVRSSPLKAPMLKPPTSTPLPDFNFPTLDQENEHTGLTPFKSLAGIPEASNEEEDFSHLLHSDESEPGIDLLQGFAKIGARATTSSAVAPNGSPQKKGINRPGLGRSTSTRF